MGGDGNDTLNGQAGNDSLGGGAGNDSLAGGVDNDLLDGNDGNDTVDGGDGDDDLFGGNGDDSIVGGAGNDSLIAGAGNDIMEGGSGNDSIGFEGADNHNVQIYTGDGDDSLYFASESEHRVTLDAGAGNNPITLERDFEDGENGYFYVSDMDDDGYVETLVLRMDGGLRVYCLNFFDNTENYQFYYENDNGQDTAAILNTLGDSVVSQFIFNDETVTLADYVEEHYIVLP